MSYLFMETKMRGSIQHLLTSRKHQSSQGTEKCKRSMHTVCSVNSNRGCQISVQLVPYGVVISNQNYLL
jgi:hypothetical protein